MFSFKHAPWFYALAAAAFLAMGGAVWFMQFKLSRRDVPTPPNADEATIADREILRFSRKHPKLNYVQAIWELDDQGQDTGYELEVETNTEGSYLFPFRNVLDTPVELGFQQSACDCNSGDVCLLPKSEWQDIDALLTRTPWAEPRFASPPQWQTLRRDDPTPFVVPAGGHGLIRVRWDARKQVGSQLRIAIKFWSRDAAAPSGRQIDELKVPAKTVSPVLIVGPKTLALGALGPGAVRQLGLDFWSATRDHPDVAFAPREPSPHFQVDARPLSANECIDLQKKIRSQGMVRRVRSGFHVTATIRENANQQQLSQGPFAFTIAVKVDEIPIELAPTLSGMAKGDVEVGGPEDQEKIQLGTFVASEDRVVVVPLYADPKLAIEPLSSSPPFLKVQLKRSPKGSTPQQARWDLRVTVPAHAWIGPLPPHATVTLRIPGDTPRLINIPVVGLATQ